jgi:hypothetical protein
MDRPGFQPFEREETSHRWLFHRNPKRICIRLKFDDCLTRQTAKGRRPVPNEVRGMETCHIHCLLDEVSSRARDTGVETNLWEPRSNRQLRGISGGDDRRAASSTVNSAKCSGTFP